MPSDVRFSEIQKFVKEYGWVLIRIRGSHHIFQMPDGRIFVVPVHKKKVKHAYLREIKKLLEEN